MTAIATLPGMVASEPAAVTIARKLAEKIPAPCKRVLLINSPLIGEADFMVDKALNARYWCYPPYGCGVLARNLKVRGYEVKIIDLNFELLRAAQRERASFDYKIWRRIVQEGLDTFQPDLLGLSCMFTMEHEQMKAVAGFVRTVRPTLPIIAGGVHITNAAKLVFEDCPEIDFISLYEGDTSFPDMIDYLNGKKTSQFLAQLAAMDDDRYVVISKRATPNGTEQLSPDYLDLPIGEYDAQGQIGTYGCIRPGRKASSALTKRGCRARCSFCSVESFNGQGVRLRSVSETVDEIERLAEDHGIRHITWLDDDLLYNRRETISLFHEMAKRKLDLTWDASNGLIAAAINEEILDAAVASGCIGFNLGIESGNPQILREVHKPGTVEGFRKAGKLLEKYPQIFVKGFLIIGFPHETMGMMLDTVNLALELEHDWYAVQILNPLPSTEIYKTMVEEGLIEDNLQTGDVAFVFGPHGRQRLREQREKLSASEFFDLFTTVKRDEIPPKRDLGDYWFLIDYKINYEIIFKLKNEKKLLNKEAMLDDICSRIAPDNPLAHLFLGIVREKLGRRDALMVHAARTESLLAESDYWRKRFETLQLDPVLADSRLKWSKEAPVA